MGPNFHSGPFGGRQNSVGSMSKHFGGGSLLKFIAILRVQATVNVTTVLDS